MDGIRARIAQTTCPFSLPLMPSYDELCNADSDSDAK